MNIGLMTGITGSGSIAPLTDYALEFNGTDEYLQIALPAELVTNGNFETNVSNWTVVGTFTQDTELGKQGNYCAKWVYSNQGISPTLTSAIVIGQKYKVKLYYKSTTDLQFRSNVTTVYTLKATSEWNYASFVFTAVSTNVTLVGIGTGTAFLDNVSIVLDQGFDLNKDQEMILHSKNWDFERTLGTELNSGTVTIGKKYVVTAGTVEGNAVGTEFLAVTNATTLDASNKVKPIDCLSRGTAIGTYNAPTDTFTVDSPTWGSVGFQSFLLPYKAYKFSFYVTNYVSGVITVQAGDDSTGYTNIPIPSGNGVKECIFYSQTNSSLRYVFVRGDSAPKYSLSYFHFYEIPEWTSSGNHTQNVSILDKSGTTGQSLLISASGAGRGAELVTNGTFDSNITGWTAIGANTVLANVSGMLSISNNGVIYGVARSTSFNITTGKIYQVSINHNTSNYVDMYVRKVDTTILHTLVVTKQRDILTFTATYTGAVTIDIQNKLSTSGYVSFIEDISIKEYLGEVSLPSANLESCVSGKKYTLEGFARLDPTSLTYGSNLASGWDFTSGWTADGATINSATQFTTSGGNNRIYFTAGWNEIVLKAVKIIVAGTVSTGTLNFRTGDSTVNPTVSGAFDTTLYMLNGSNPILQLKPSAVGAVVTITKFEVYSATPITLTAQLGTKAVTSSALSIVAGTFTKFVLNFEATASEVNQDLKLYLNGAGNVYVDKLSLTQAYDYWMTQKIKLTNYRVSNRMILNTGGMAYINYGISIYRDSATTLSTHMMSGATSADANLSMQYGTISDDIYLTISFLVDNANIKTYKNSILAYAYTRKIGKVLQSEALSIFGTNGINAQSGQISHIQIIRFENISQSTFNSAIKGLQYPTGGGVEEVLRVTFQDGSSIVNCLKDYSPKAHTVSGVLVDITNRRKVTTYETESQTIFNSLTGYYTDSRRNAINNLVLSLKTAGIWTKLDVLQVYSAINSADALINWKTPGTFNATLVNSPTFTADTGIAGNGTTSYINSGYNPTTALNKYVLNSGFIGVYSRSNINEPMTLVNNQSGPSAYISGIEFQKTAPYIKYSINGDTQTVFSSTVRQGFFVASRTGANTIKGYINGVPVVSDTVGSSAIYGANIFVGAKNNGGTAATFATHEISMFMAGSGLNDSEVLSLYSAVEAYLDNIGAGVIT